MGLAICLACAWALSEDRAEINEKHIIVSLGLKSIVAGTLVTCMIGAVVGLLV